MGKSSGKEMIKYCPMYPYFSEKCVKPFDTEIYYGLVKSFSYQRMTIDNKTGQDLSKAEVDYLNNLI